MKQFATQDHSYTRLDSSRARKILALVAAILVITAVLKLIAVFRLPVLQVQPDAVIFFTSREVMLLAGVAELLLAYVLIAWNCVMSRVYLIWIFCLAALVYHVGSALSLNTEGCKCLGVVESWLGRRLAESFSIILLLALAGLGLLAIRQSDRLRGVRTTVARGKQFVLVFAYAFSFGIHCRGASVAVDGMFYYVSEQGRSLEKHFTAELDHTSLLFQFVSTDAGPYVPSGPCTNITRIDPKTIITHSRCLGVAQETIRLDDATLAYELGNCGNDLATALFLTLKLEALFPIGKGNGERRLAPTQASIGLPLSLVSTGKWRYELANDDTRLNCDIIIDGQLLKKWPSSPFLLEEIRTDELRMRRERFFLEKYKGGMVVERLRWSKLTNLAGVTFATLFEAERQHLIPHRDPRLQTKLTRSWSRVVINEVREMAIPVRTIFPILGADIHVTEARLRDRQRGIAFVSYRTNLVESPAITTVAMADLERRRRSADKRAKVLRTKKVFTVILLTLIIMTPAVVSMVRSRVSCRSDLRPTSNLM